MKNYRNPARKDEIKCRDCKYSFRPMAAPVYRPRFRCTLTGNDYTYAVAATGTCDLAKASGGGEG